MSTYSPITLWMRGNRGHFIVSPHVTPPQPPPPVLDCCFCCCWAISSKEPFWHFSAFWLASISLTLGGYITTCWFGLTSADNLHMQLHLDEIISRYCWCGREILFIYPFTFLKCILKKYPPTRGHGLKHSSHGPSALAPNQKWWNRFVPGSRKWRCVGSSPCSKSTSHHGSLRIPKWRLNPWVKQKQHGGIIFWLFSHVSKNITLQCVLLFVFLCVS